MKKLVVVILILAVAGAAAFFITQQEEKSYSIFDAKESNKLAQARVREVCSRNAYLCREFEEDEYCQSERAQVLVIGEIIKTDDKDENQYHYLTALDSFLLCTEKHLGIQYLNPAERYANKELTPEEEQVLADKMAKFEQKSGLRYRNLQKLNEKIDILNQYALTSKDPYLLFWSWSALGHSPALDALVIADEQGKLTSYDLQYFISQAYIKYDENRAKKAMFNALRDYPVEKYVPLPVMRVKPSPSRVAKHIHLSIFKELMEIYLDDKDFKRAYLFAHLIRLNNDTTVDVDMVKDIASDAAVNTHKIEQVAETYHQQLLSGTFEG